MNVIFNVLDPTFYCFYAIHVFTLASFTGFNFNIGQQNVFLIAL